MAFTYTVDGATVMGNKRVVHGTFTSATGDSSATLSASTHGLNNIIDYKFTLDTGGVNVQNPKVTISSGTLTAVFDDTLGYSGKWVVTGS